MLFVCILSNLLFISCKKENSNSLQVVAGDQLKAIKEFYKSKQVTGPDKNISEGTPQWEKTIFNTEQGKYLVPVTISPEKATGKYSIHKYLLISSVKNELSGEYLFAMQNTGSDQMLNDRQIENAVLENIPAADLVIARRDLQQLAINKAPGKYINTKIKRQDVPSLQKNNTDTVVVANSLPMANCEANGGIIVEIEWWYQEYDQYGHVVYEEYVYSTYECWASGGGGSGGGGSTTGTSAACGSITGEQAQELLNKLEGEVTGHATYTSIAIENRNGAANTTEGLGTIRKVVLPKYSFYTLRLMPNSSSAVTWFANYSGIVYKNSERDYWKWESINFVNVSEEGNPPICFDYQMYANVASPIIEPDKKRAQSAVSFSVSAKVACMGGWKIKSETGSIPTIYLDAQ